jgi:hypothetical protein
MLVGWFITYFLFDLFLKLCGADIHGHAYMYTYIMLLCLRFQMNGLFTMFVFVSMANCFHHQRGCVDQFKLAMDS